MSQEERRTSSGRREPAGERERPREREQRPRKKRKKGVSLMGTLLYVAFVIGVSTLLAAVGWVAANDLLALNKAEHAAIITLPDDIFTSREVTVETEDGTETETELSVDMDYVVDALKENGIIEYGLLFRLYSVFSNAKYKMAPGTYELDTDMDYRALLANLGSNSASRMVVTVTIPEGLTQAQIFALLEENGVSTVEQLEDTAANYDYNFSFLKGVLPLGDPKRLEGYLFPDTYDFYMGEDPVNVLNKMILRFDEIFTEEMRQRIVDRGYTINDAVIIASMIEKETDGQDQAEIASVIYNRLENTSATNGLLNIDAAILYATGGTQVDTSADTPYNTYLHPGLPPTAIASPGADALRAAVNPASTNYYYYALGDDGMHHFFTSHQAQLDFIAQQERYQSE